MGSPAKIQNLPQMTDPKPNTTKKLSASPTLWLLVISVVALVERLLVIVLYLPVSYGDTPSYRRLADTVMQGFASYDGTRTPGYPVFFALVGNDQRVWLVQLFLGFVTTLLLFYIGWKLTDKPWFGGLIALAHTLNLGQLFFESNLLTESLTTFLMVVTIAGMLAWLLYPKFRRLWLAFLLGLLSTITLLVRPLFIYLPFFLLLFLWIGSRVIQTPKKLADEGENILNHQTSHFDLSWHIGIGFLLPVVLLLGGWIIFIHKNFGEWSLTTMTGYHLVQHTGNFFEYVPDEYASLRDTYIKYRDAHIAQYGTQTNAIWDAIPEMSQVSGYSFYALSRVLTRISIQLILQHPFLYLKNALLGWWMFWRVPVYWSADALRYPWMAGGLTLVILIERVLVFFINMVFIFASIYFALVEFISNVRRKPSILAMRYTHPSMYVFLWMLLGNIWIASILQTLLDHGDNPRFLVPLQSLVVLWVAAFILQWVVQKQTVPPPTP
jgi:hypothetical protein